MSVDNLIGLYLDACRFSKSSYTLEFSGIKNDQYFKYDVSTSYYLCFTGAVLEGVDPKEKISIYLWDFLEKKVDNIVVNAETYSAKIVFSDNSFFYFYGKEPLHDNLLIITDKQSNKWFSVL